MKTKSFNNIILLGLIATIGILVAQLLWTREAFNLEEKKFNQKVQVALLEVVKKLCESKKSAMPSENPIEKISNDYFVANVENDFSPEILEHYLKTSLAKYAVTTDFEYAMYNCQSDEMVYGDYISYTKENSPAKEISFPKHKNLVYYFAIRFPNQTSYLLSSLRFWILLSFALAFILIIYVYSIYTIVQQKKYSELQRDFINNMTHEFKTPLSSILLASTYLQKQPWIQEHEKANQYTGIIITQSQKLNHHIEKILNTAKSDTTHLDLDIQKFDLLACLQNCIATIQLKHENATLEIKSQLDAITLEADEFHFSNVVYNLIDNAIKYSDTSPEITIDLKMTYTHFILSCIDNGIGIDKDKLPFIFDKFYRVPNAKRNEVNGFGLGLYYVQKICKLHHWKITAKSNPVNGITMSILIPAKTVNTNH